MGPVQSPQSAEDSKTVVFCFELLLYMYGCFANMHICVSHMCSVQGGQKRTSVPLELELEALGSHYGVQESNLARSSPRTAARALNCYALSPVLPRDYL